MERKGIDVSKWQGTIDWDKVKKAGIDFAMIRAGFGKESSQIDKCFLYNIKHAQANNINVGVYWYSYAKNIDDAKQEAIVFLSVIKGYKLEYPVVFDIEDNSQTSLSKRLKTDICNAFCNEIEKAGYYAMIYSNCNWLENHLYKDELLAKYDLWLAHWNADKPKYPCGIWQTTDKGIVDGISGTVDLNTSFKDYPAIMKAKGINGFNNANNTNNANTKTYIIQRGDTLSSIAKKCNTTVSKIAKDNNIEDVNKIYAGQSIVIRQ